MEQNSPGEDYDLHELILKHKTCNLSDGVENIERLHMNGDCADITLAQRWTRACKKRSYQQSQRQRHACKGTSGTPDAADQFMSSITFTRASTHRWLAGWCSSAHLMIAAVAALVHVSLLWELTLEGPMMSCGCYDTYEVLDVLTTC